MSQTVFNPLLPFGLDQVGTSSGGGGGTSSVVNTGTTDGTTLATAPLFFNTSTLALKIYYSGAWITIAQVTFDSLWNSTTDAWDSTSMDWDAPL